MKSVRFSLWRMGLVCALAGATALTAAQTSSSGRLLVVFRDSSELGIVDAASGKLLGRVPTVKGPHEVTTDGKLAFMGSPAEGVGVIDIATQKELRRFNPPGSAPHDVLFGNGTLFFTAEGYKSIGRYNPATKAIEWMLGLGQNGSHMLVLGRDPNIMYVANQGSNTVSFVEGIAAGPPKWQVTAAVPVPGHTVEALDLSPDGRELWAAASIEGTVHVIDVATRKVTYSAELGMKDGNRLRITPDGKQVLLLDGGGEGTPATFVVLDRASRKEVTRIKLWDTETGAGGFWVTRDGSRAYIGLRTVDRVAVVDLKTLAVINHFPMPPKSGPGCIVWLD